MEEEKLKIIQRLGEDMAYTFKGLYKESDWLKFKYQFFLSVPIVFSLISFGFDEEIPALGIKILTLISLISIFLALLGRDRFDLIDSYRCLANEIKTIYDRAEEAYYLREMKNYCELRQQWNAKKKQTQKYPIGKIGRFLCKRRIKAEMDLSWLGGEYRKQ